MQNQELQEPDYNEPLVKAVSQFQNELPVSPDNPHWGTVQAVITWILSVFAIILFPALFLGPYIAIYRDQDVSSLASNPTAIVLNLLAIFPAHLFTLLVAWFVVTQKGKYTLAETLGFESGGFLWWHYPLLIIGFFILAASVSLVLPEGENDLIKMLRSSRSALIVTAILATFTAPVVEEVVYRGVLYSAFNRSIGTAGAVGLVTALFALVHVPQYWGSPASIALICLLSLILTLIRVKSKNILPCVIMHTLFNGIQSVVLLAEPYLPKVAEPESTPAGAFLRFFN